MTTRPRTLRNAFVALALLVLFVYLTIQALAAVRARGPQARINELMPVIGAQVVGKPLSFDIARFPLEGSPQDRAAAAFRLDSYPPDTVIFLNFWATWCEPCVREMPSMLALLRRMSGRPFVMLAVSYDDDWPTISSFLTRVFGGIPSRLHVARDPTEEETQTMRWRMGTQKIPETYVILNGQILSRFVNARDWADDAIVEYFELLTEL